MSATREVNNSDPDISDRNGQGSNCTSPLGATSRPSLPQQYRLRNGSALYKTDQQKNGHRLVTSNDYTQLRNRHEAAIRGTRSSAHSFVILILIFGFASFCLGIVYISFPDLEPDEIQHIKLPRDIEDAQNLGLVLSRYTDKYYYEVIGGYLVSFIFLQSFAIPGSIFLSILSGYLFSFPVALFLVCLSSATGATICYMLSDLVGRRIVYKYIPDRVIEWSQTVERHREHMINYIIFLRTTPLLPNWFINIVSPIINVPIIPFFLGTFIGVAPPSFLAIQAGTTLQSLTSSSDSVSWTSVVVLCVFAVLSMLPVVFKKYLREKVD